MNFGRSSKIHLVIGRMFREEINITVSKAREGGSSNGSSHGAPHLKECCSKGQ